MKLEDFSPKYFQDARVPDEGQLVGYAAIIHNLNVQSPLKYSPACVSQKYKKQSAPHFLSGFYVYGKRYWPGVELTKHLEFSLKWENFDLLCLNRIMSAIQPEVIESWLVEKPTSIYARRVWFLYEFLTGKEISAKDLKKVVIKPLLDPNKYYTNLSGPISKRHRIQNNLLGNKNFCPIIRKTEKLELAIGQSFDRQANNYFAGVSKSLIVRTASFLLLADTQASFAIEGQRAPRNRIERWLKAVASVRNKKLDFDELIRLHRVLIHDDRFIKIGIREEEVFLGERDGLNLPVPEFIGAKKDDLKLLLKGFFQTAEILEKSDVNSVLQATALAFGFIYIHPHVDGNGRLHRLILHHVLSHRGYAPSGVTFPISSVLLERIDDYRLILTSHSVPLMGYIDWEATDQGNVRIKNETADLYKYFDCTEEAEFIYECVEYTIKKIIPTELAFLKAYDMVLNEIDLIVEMPNERTKRLVHYIRENNGKLGKNRREGEFKKLTNQEIDSIENIVVKYLDIR